jgi:hypothetical protein
VRTNDQWKIKNRFAITNENLHRENQVTVVAFFLQLKPSFYAGETRKKKTELRKSLSTNASVYGKPTRTESDFLQIVKKREKF